MKITDIIELTEDQSEALAPKLGRFKDAKTAFHAAANMLRLTSDDYFETIREMFPELEGWDFAVAEEGDKPRKIRISGRE